MAATRPFVILFLLGAALRFAGVPKPIDLPNWRECDVASIARNYYREDMNLFYPRIDWRGDGAGYVESEFPLYPWTVAVLYHVFGIHEQIARVIPFVLSLVSMLAVFGLARRLLPPPGALVAAAFFVASPLANLIGYSIQPEGLMNCAYWIAAYAFLRWTDDDRRTYFCLAVGATALAILGKVTAAHIGIFFALWLISERGLRRAVLAPSSWIFGVAALAPAILWYGYAYRLWTTYGNSLGFSNEDHWARADLFTNPRLLGGVVAIDLWFVWTIPGALIAVYGIWADRRARVVRFAGLWLIAVFAYYLLAARTLSGLWANYYHAAAIVPAALLVGHGVGTGRRYGGRVWCVAVATVLGACAWIAGAYAIPKLSPRFADRIVGVPPLPPVLIALLAIAVLAGTLVLTRHGVSAPVCLCLAPALFCGLALSAMQLRYNTGHDRYVCARQLSPNVPRGALIAASGGFRIGPTGRPAASDAPYMFYWLDRKGFSLANEDQSVAALERLAARGARLFVAEKDAVHTKPGFETELLTRYRMVAECSTAWLFDITQTLSSVDNGSRGPLRPVAAR